MRYGHVIEYRRRSLLYGFSGPTCRIRGTACYGRSTHKRRPPRNDRIRLCTHTCAYVSLPSTRSFLSVSIRLSLSFHLAPRARRLGFPRHIRVNGPRGPLSPSSADTILNRLLASKNVDIIFPLFDGPDTRVKLTVLNCIRWNVPAGTRPESEGKGYVLNNL